MKRNIKIFIVFGLLSIGLGACRKMIDINENPNQPTEQSITPELILPNALHSVGAQTALGYGWLANWMGYWSASGSFNPSTEESSYNITTSFQTGKWTGIYNTLFDLDRVEVKARDKNQTFYRAIAIIMKAHLFQNLVDLYGNVPYSQAFKPNEFPSPKYDKAEDIYADLHVRLDSAVNFMKTVNPGVSEKNIDIVFEGDKNLWIKLANTIKLRLLIRTTQINPNPAAQYAKIKANGGVLQSGESADVLPPGGYLNDVNKQSPFFAAYGTLPNGNEANTFFRANAYAITRLKQTNDPRLSYFFAPAASPSNPADPFLGTTYGASPNATFAGERTSNIGKGLVKSFSQAQWIVTSVESMFLQAEAVARGWDIGGPVAGNARMAYEAAVRESFIWLGVTDAANTANTFLQTPGADWTNAGTSTDDKIALIIRQKYIALTGINPLEAWNDYRRLGIPNDIPLSINPARGNRTIPVRLLYPAGEYAVNATSVLAQGTITTQSTIFWDR
jgi:hypothetical protein